MKIFCGTKLNHENPCAVVVCPLYFHGRLELDPEPSHSYYINVCIKLNFLTFAYPYQPFDIQAKWIRNIPMFVMIRNQKSYLLSLMCTLKRTLLCLRYFHSNCTRCSVIWQHSWLIRTFLELRFKAEPCIFLSDAFFIQLWLYI